MQSVSLIDPEMTNWFNDRWLPEMGAIDGFDLRFLAALIAEARPKVVVELGCASGLSTSMLAMMLDKVGGGTVTSFDLNTQFYADPSKVVGYLVNEMLAVKQTRIEIVTERRCLAVPDRFEAETVDFCFIDASHQHPWPLIDTLVLLPVLKAGAYMAHHDPVMAWGPNHHATGPKLLQLLLPAEVAVAFDGLVSSSDADGLRTRAKSGNIFALRRPKDIGQFASYIAEGFLLGWDTAHSPRRVSRIGDDFAARLMKYFRRVYAPEVADAFAVGLKRYNAAADSHYKRPSPD